MEFHQEKKTTEKKTTEFHQEKNVRRGMSRYRQKHRNMAKIEKSGI